MYFPKVELHWWNHPSVHGRTRTTEWLRTVVINQDDVETILIAKTKTTQKKAMEASINEHQEQSDRTDIEAYSRGELDRIDLSVKYGLDYKDLKKVFTACFEQDIGTLWKAP